MTVRNGLPLPDASYFLGKPPLIKPFAAFQAFHSPASDALPATSLAKLCAIFEHAASTEFFPRRGNDDIQTTPPASSFLSIRIDTSLTALREFDHRAGREIKIEHII